jgi:hypothetical protein
MTDDLVAMLRRYFPADMKHEYPQTCLTEYEYERQKASDRIEELEAALREIGDCCTLPAQNDFEMREIARKALEGKDE